MKNILIICGHPDKNSLNSALAQTYRDELESRTSVRYIHLRDLEFNYNLEFGYNKRTELEPDLLQTQADIQWADHVTIFFPTWWGSYPAVLKAFFDRVLLPGYAFKYHTNSPFWDKLLKGKSARIVTTMHTPKWYYKIFYSSPSIKALKKVTLQFCGISKVKTTIFSSTQNNKHKPKDAWFEKVKKLAIKDF